MSIITGNPNFPTQSQVPDNSILDINGRQTYLGNTFILPINGQTLDSADEVTVALIQNPATNKKSIFLYTRSATADALAVLRYYFNPTIVTTGTPTTPVNLRSASSTVSSTLCYLTPTTSANGTFFSTVGTEVTIEVTNNVLVILDPGQSLLITAQSPTWSMGNNVLVYSENVWYEL
jgi:hypothetical protein